MKPNVLVVDGNQGMRDQLGRMLALRGYTVRLAADETDAHASLKASRPALVIATVDPPRLDAIALCRSVRESTGTPVIILSRGEQVETEVEALDAGADDYVVLPLRHESFLARIRAVLRRSGVTPEVSAVESGPFHIDFDDRRVRIRGQAVRLTPKEFDLFTFMAKHPNRVLPHKMLLGRGVGTCVRRAVGVPARLRRPAAQEARTRSGQAASPGHGALGGLPVQSRRSRTGLNVAHCEMLIANC
jgi:DNA-binding response OmpR family regulator